MRAQPAQWPRGFARRRPAPPSRAHRPGPQNIGDVQREELIRLREWLRLYKTAEGKGENEFANGGEPVDSAAAISVVMHTHRQWRRLAQGGRRCSHWTPGPAGEKVERECWVLERSAPGGQRRG